MSDNLSNDGCENRSVNTMELDVAFYLKHAYSAHKSKVKELEKELEKYKELAIEGYQYKTELQKYKDLCDAMQDKLRQQNHKISSLEKKNRSYPKKNATTQVRRVHFNFHSNDIATQVDYYDLRYTRDENQSPKRKVRKIQTSKSPEVILQWIANVEPEIILAPESAPIETLNCERQLLTGKIIPETEMQESMLQQKQEQTEAETHHSERDATIPLEKTKLSSFSLSSNLKLPVPQDTHHAEGPLDVVIKTESFSQSNLENQSESPSSEKEDSELLVPQEILKKHHKISKLSRKSRKLPKALLPELQQDASPNIFSSPEGVTIKQEVGNNDLDMTMLPEEYALMKKVKCDQVVEDPSIQDEPSNDRQLDDSEKLVAVKKSDGNSNIEVNIINSFDQVVKADENAGINYKYKDNPVRKQSERQHLTAYECPDCVKYFADLPENERNRRLQACSRHRSTHPPPPRTPEHYWEIGFPDSPETIIVPFKSRRKIPLKMIN